MRVSTRFLSSDAVFDGSPGLRTEDDRAEAHPRLRARQAGGRGVFAGSGRTVDDPAPDQGHWRVQPSPKSLEPVAGRTRSRHDDTLRYRSVSHPGRR